VTSSAGGSSNALLALVGPTASGKTEASIAVAERLGAEIVNVDSTLVFRGMDAWTGKPTAEQRARVPHHLIDVVDPVGPFSVAAFQREAWKAIEAIHARGRRALLVGGSGLYYRAVMDRLEFPGTEPRVRALLEAEAGVLGSQAMHRRLAAFDPAAAARMEPSNARRAVRALEVAAITGRPFSTFGAAWDVYEPGAVVAGIDVPRDVLHRRIDRRAGRGFPALVEETRALVAAGFGPFIDSSHVIGYAEAAACLRGEVSQEDAIARIAKRDRALARRQLAWFRRDPRIRWFPVGEDGSVRIVDELVAHFEAASETRTGTRGGTEA
jgi:tRNA dimethylallyltransferase